MKSDPDKSSVSLHSNMASFSIQIPVPRFSGVGGSVATFIADLKSFAETQNPAWTAAQLVSFLPLCLDGAAKQAFSSLTQEQKATLDSIETALGTFCVPLTRSLNMFSCHK